MWQVWQENYKESDSSEMQLLNTILSINYKTKGPRFNFIISYFVALNEYKSSLSLFEIFKAMYLESNPFDFANVLFSAFILHSLNSGRQFFLNGCKTIIMKWKEELITWKLVLYFAASGSPIFKSYWAFITWYLVKWFEGGLVPAFCLHCVPDEDRHDCSRKSKTWIQIITLLTLK